MPFPDGHLNEHINRLYILYLIGYYFNELGELLLYSQWEKEIEFFEKELGASILDIGFYSKQIIVGGLINTGDIKEKIKELTLEDILFMIKYYKEVDGIGSNTGIQFKLLCEEKNYSKLLVERIKELFPCETILMERREWGQFITIRGRAYREIKVLL